MLARALSALSAALLLAFAPVAVRAQVFLNEIVDMNDRIGPTGLAIDTVGTVSYLYAVDNNNGRVVKYNLATGARVATFGSVGNGPGEFLSPYGIAVDPISHDLYIAERGNHRVQRIRSTDGAFVMTWGGRGSANGQFIEPIGVATDATGNVYVADHGNNRVQKFNVQGGTAHLQTVWGTTGSAAGQFNGPYGITVSANGSVYVADAFNGRVQRFNANGGYLATIGAGLFDTPTSIGFDAAGNYYVTDTNRDPQNASHPNIQRQRVHKISAADSLLSTWGSLGEAGGQFRLPFTVVVDASGNGYISDYYNTRIQKFNFNTNLPLSAPTINSVLTANATASQSFSYIIFARGYPAATTFAATGLPAGLAIDTTTGLITGTPTASGSYSVTLRATNSAGSGTATLNLTVGGAPGSPVISSPATASGNVGTAFSYQVTASNSPTSYSATGLAPGLTINAATGAIAGTPTTAGTYTATVSATNAIGTNSAQVTITIGASTGGGNGSAQAVAPGGTATFTATVPAGATVQWLHNGTPIANATAATHVTVNAQSSSAGVYTAVITNGGATTTQSFVLSIALPATSKVIGSGREVGSNIVHQNGGIYDQILLEGPSTTFRADAGQVTRCSYLDVDGDIVQVEFSGAGSVSVILDPASYTAPAFPEKYNQQVAYARGHATIVVAGANETTNVTVFSVGTLTAVNQTLFRSDVTYEGMSTISTVGVHSSTGQFGGLRTANANYLNTKGVIGVYAPGVQFESFVYIGDINADGTAWPVIQLGTTDDVSIRGGDLLQLNGRAVQVSGISRLPFLPNGNSHGVAQPAQNCAGTLEENGRNVTADYVVNPN